MRRQQRGGTSQSLSLQVPFAAPLEIFYSFLVIYSCSFNFVSLVVSRSHRARPWMFARHVHFRAAARMGWQGWHGVPSRAPAQLEKHKEPVARTSAGSVTADPRPRLSRLHVAPLALRGFVGVDKPTRLTPS